MKINQNKKYSFWQINHIGDSQIVVAHLFQCTKCEQIIYGNGARVVRGTETRDMVLEANKLEKELASIQKEECGHCENCYCNLTQEELEEFLEG